MPAATYPNVVALLPAMVALCGAFLTLTDPLVPGTYMISDEQKQNEDLCKLRTGGSAYLQIYPWGQSSMAVAVSWMILTPCCSRNAL